MEEILQAGVEALREKQVDAHEYIRRTRQPHQRSITIDGGGAFNPTGAWGNPTYPIDVGEPRSGVQRAQLADGRVVYVDV
jgi:hypothetical protein